MTRLETLIELNFVNSTFSSSKFSIRALRACPLIEIRQTAPRRPRRAIRGKSSDSKQQYLSQQYPAPLLTAICSQLSFSEANLNIDLRSGDLFEAT